MIASRALAAEQAVALTAGVARDLIAQGDGKGLPRPRFLFAIFAFYGSLGLLSAFGRTAARVAVAFGGVAALTTVVVGPGGPALIGLFQRLSGLTQGAPTVAAGQGGSASSTGPPPSKAAQGKGGPLVGSGVTGTAGSGGPRSRPATVAGGGGGAF